VLFGYSSLKIDDGNLISDGRWQYFYDGENRLIKMESQTSVLSSRRRKLIFTYDYLGRRVKKAVYTWNTSTSAYNTSPSSGSKFVYDGWNLIAELGVSDVKLIRSYTWGQDLSGSLQGAGGIGGLVFVRQYATEAGSYYPACDANGNLTAMIRASDGKVGANYDYSPYGELLASSGSYASTNPFRFSTKYTDAETNLAYFGYRYYNPDTGRWLNRDPIEEKGGGNLYGYVNNQPITNIDPLGNDFLDCMIDCLKGKDPLNVLGKMVPPACSVTVKKSWQIPGQKERTFLLTKVKCCPPWIGRLAGRISLVITVGEGLYYAGAEAYCAATCIKNGE
jgi:RHS repeat-associated protein